MQTYNLFRGKLNVVAVELLVVLLAYKVQSSGAEESFNNDENLPRVTLPVNKNPMESQEYLESPSSIKPMSMSPFELLLMFRSLWSVTILRCTAINRVAHQSLMEAIMEQLSLNLEGIPPVRSEIYTELGRMTKCLLMAQDEIIEALDNPKIKKYPKVTDLSKTHRAIRHKRDIYWELVSKPEQKIQENSDNDVEPISRDHEDRLRVLEYRQFNKFLLYMNDIMKKSCPKSTQPKYEVMNAFVNDMMVRIIDTSSSTLNVHQFYQKFLVNARIQKSLKYCSRSVNEIKAVE